MMPFTARFLEIIFHGKHHKKVCVCVCVKYCKVKKKKNVHIVVHFFSEAGW